MAIPVKLNVFEGPLDLLLHLIDKNKIDIYDIPIVEITDQYMEYIHAMEKEDLGVMSEKKSMKKEKRRTPERSWFRNFWNIRCINICLMS